MSNNRMSKYKIFTQTPWDKKAATFYTLLAFISITYAVLFDAARIDALATGKDAALLIASSAFVCMSLFFVLMLSKWVFLFSAPILFYIGAVSSTYASTYLFNVTSKTAPLFFDNSVINAFARNAENVVFLVGMFLLGLVVGLIRFFYATDFSIVRKGQAFAVILIITSVGTGFLREQNPIFLPQPYAYIVSIQKYLNEKVTDYFTKTLPEESTARNGSDVLGVVIFVDKLSSKGDFTGFETRDGFYINKNMTPNFINPRHNFLSSITGIGKDNEKDINDSVNFMADFSKLNYPVLWFSVYNLFTRQDQLINRIATNNLFYSYAENAGYPNPFLAIETFDIFLRNKNKGLFVVNLEGTPPKIGERYGEVFLHGDKGIQDSWNRAYAQYLVQTEAFIGEIKNRLENKPAFIIMIGLEGEEISNFNDFRSTNQDNLSSVFALWTSDSLGKHTQAQDNITMDYLYHTVLGCSGIITDNFQQSKSLCGGIELR